MSVEQTILRKATTTEWADADASDGAAAPTLDAGEVGVDVTTGQIAVSPADNSAFPALLKHRPARIITTTASVAGVKVVTDALITANSIVIPILKTLAGVSLPVAVAVTARSVGVSFTLTSGSASDTSTYTCLIIEP